MHKIRFFFLLNIHHIKKYFKYTLQITVMSKFDINFLHELFWEILQFNLSFMESHIVLNYLLPIKIRCN